jgi:hypothetical protein
MRSTKVFQADAGSTDGTQDLAMSFAGRLDIEVIPADCPQWDAMPEHDAQPRLTCYLLTLTWD